MLIGTAARANQEREAGLMIAGGRRKHEPRTVVHGKAESAFSRAAKIEDTTIGWRFVNALMKAQYGVDRCPRLAKMSLPNMASTRRPGP